jgi:ATP-dependent exoDNAse (exonuclease V) alpha subunit
LFHFDVGYFSRGRGQSIVAAAAYRSGQRLYDHYYGEPHDFTNKGGIIRSWILLPPNAPPEYGDRESLWNAVEFREDKSTRKGEARLAREVEGALPVELKTLDERIRLVERYVNANFVSRGMIADITIEDKGNGNPHFHCLLTTRNITPDGFGLKNRAWDKKEIFNQWRREWADEQNREYERLGIDKKVSHESYAAQDLGCKVERKPGIHLGPQVIRLDQIGIETDRMKKYREIIEYNRKEREHQQERKRKRERSR